ncbi:hypothetical protein N7499_006421 [Penicillium canescens]|nr:hypothetical protein N7522_008936 [Penicillium canescens]KAJ6081547.1 hypothetical protein N7499_006421 [Penicillium canescens]KAJ6176655.1 hypothetical protein N7485_003569 [Penicillium canescens]
MPKVVWTAEADAQLLLLVLDQLKDANFALDTEQLAAGMGPEFNKRGIQYRLNALRKQDKEQPSPTKGGFTPINSPVKRKAGRPPRTPAKKQKNQNNDDEADDELLGVVVQGDHHGGN